MTIDRRQRDTDHAPSKCDKVIENSTDIASLKEKYDAIYEKLRDVNHSTKALQTVISGWAEAHHNEMMKASSSHQEAMSAISSLTKILADHMKNEEEFTKVTNSRLLKLERMYWMVSGALAIAVFVGDYVLRSM